MATTKELTQQVEALQKRVTQLGVTNSKLVDEVALLKNNYAILVDEVSERLEAVQKRFRK
tara:strand:+ start:97 stop:276 length:180 start_codon:yes stop_codon:yes gene_type:complete